LFDVLWNSVDGSLSDSTTKASILVSTIRLERRYLCIDMSMSENDQGQVEGFGKQSEIDYEALAIQQRDHDITTRMKK
jgi:hypothetical protein